MAKKKTTIGDIANALGISKTTVSFVLNGKARDAQISLELERKVLDYIQEVGYVPNQYAQSLRSGKTKLIGVLVEDISDVFFSAIARRIEERAYLSGYRIVYSSTENKPEKAKEMLEIYKNNRVDGYIIAPTPSIEQEINSLVKDGFPVVLFDRILPGVSTDSVMVDNYKSSYDAMRHLFDNGYANIAFITLYSDQVQMLERERAYLQFMAETGSPYTIKRIKYHENNENSIREIEQFLQANTYVDAVFFATNYIAESGLEAIKNLGYDTPLNLGIVVFDDHSMFKLFTPAITAIAQPVREIAEQSIELVLKRLLDEGDKEADYKHIVLDNKLIIRESSVKEKQ